jgi:hypothetical protein
MFDDLIEEKQQELLALLGVDDPSDYNWDIYPIAILEFEDEDEEE